MLDRDGTLITDENYLSDPDKVRLLPGAAAGLRLLADAGFRFIVATNQSGVGRGYFTEAEADAVNIRLAEILAREAVRIEGFYCCPHAPEDGCSCRKPKPGLVRKAGKQLGFTDTEICCVIGDKECDAGLADNLRTRSLLVGSVPAEGCNDAAAATAADLFQAARMIIDEGWCKR